MARPNLVNLETVLWIARLGTFTAAAQKLFTTQPAISARVRELESALGVALFERMDRGVRLTVEGRAFVEKIEPLLTQIQDALFVVEGRGAMAGVVRLGIRDSAAHWVGGVLNELQIAMPQVTYELQIHMTDDLQRKVLEGTLDAAIIGGEANDAQLVCQPLGFSPMVWVMAPSRRKTDVDPATTEGLASLLNDGPIWLVPRSSKMFGTNIETLRAFGARLEKLNTCDSMVTVIEMVIGGHGIAYLPEVLITAELSTGQLVHVSPLLAPASALFSVIYDRDRPNQIVRHVVDVLIDKSGFTKTAQAPVLKLPPR